MVVIETEVEVVVEDVTKEKVVAIKEVIKTREEVLVTEVNADALLTVVQNQDDQEIQILNLQVQALTDHDVQDVNYKCKPLCLYRGGLLILSQKYCIGILFEVLFHIFMPN